MGTHWGVLLAPEFLPRFRLVGIVWVGKQPVGISSPLTSRTTSRFYPNFPRILRFYSSATIRRSRPGKSWCPDFNSIPSGFNIKDTCYTVPYSARTSFGLGVGMILMFMSRRQRYDWRLILLCLLHATRASPWVGRSSHWIYCSFLLTTQDSPFRWDRIFVGERTRHPISGSSTRPMSHDVVVHNCCVY